MEILSKSEIWQNQECSRLGITIDQHNQLLEISGQIPSALGGMVDAYQDIVDLIALGLVEELVYRPRLTEIETTKKDSIQIIEQNPKYLGRKGYKSKKLRRDKS